MSTRGALRLGILISGRGSNMAAIAQSCRSGHLGADVALVLSEQSAAAGLQTARGFGLPTRAIPWPGAALRAQFEQEAAAALDAAGVELIVLAGFMRILSADFVTARAGRILNIHPSLLPKYPGLHTHRRVLEAGERSHGATVHYVTPQLDGGPRLLQSRIAVRAADSEESLSARVQATEHIIYPKVIGWCAEGRLQWREARPWLDGAPLLTPVVEEFDA
ncbi:MAG: phosphoribosylglycinamide formyltransferase [Steroidobacteraceae bacterium]